MERYEKEITDLTQFALSHGRSKSGKPSIECYLFFTASVWVMTEYWVTLRWAPFTCKAFAANRWLNHYLFFLNIVSFPAAIIVSNYVAIDFSRLKRKPVRLSTQHFYCIVKRFSIFKSNFPKYFAYLLNCIWHEFFFSDYESIMLLKKRIKSLKCLNRGNDVFKLVRRDVTCKGEASVSIISYHSLIACNRKLWLRSPSNR